MLSIEVSDLGDSPTHSPQDEELVEVVTHAVVNLILIGCLREWKCKEKANLMSTSFNQLNNPHIGVCHSFRVSTLMC